MTNFKTLFAAGILTAVIAVGQGHGGNGTPPDPATRVQRQVEHLTKLLTLTDTQATSATKIFTDEQAAVQTADANNQTNRTALADAVKKNDVASIDRLSAALGSTSGQVTAIHAKAQAAFYILLTPDQQTKYDTLHSGGPGGFAGPMGGGYGRMGAGRPSPQR
jgi:Spy/CpxP family protein refolding chaperone